MTKQVMSKRELQRSREALLTLSSALWGADVPDAQSVSQSLVTLKMALDHQAALEPSERPRVIRTENRL